MQKLFLLAIVIISIEYSLSPANAEPLATLQSYTLSNPNFEAAAPLVFKGSNGELDIFYVEMSLSGSKSDDFKIGHTRISSKFTALSEEHLEIPIPSQDRFFPTKFISGVINSPKGPKFFVKKRRLGFLGLDYTDTPPAVTEYNFKLPYEIVKVEKTKPNFFKFSGQELALFREEGKAEPTKVQSCILPIEARVAGDAAYDEVNKNLFATYLSKKEVPLMSIAPQMLINIAMCDVSGQVTKAAEIEGFWGGIYVDELGVIATSSMPMKADGFRIAGFDRQLQQQFYYHPEQKGQMLGAFKVLRTSKKSVIAVGMADLKLQIHLLDLTGKLIAKRTDLSEGTGNNFDAILDGDSLVVVYEDTPTTTPQVTRKVKFIKLAT